MLIPSYTYKQYFDHLAHTGLVPYDEYVPQCNVDYITPDKQRYEFAFSDDSYIVGKHLLDVGSYHGYMPFIAARRGAASVTGINIKPEPNVIANYAFDQLHIKNYKFLLGDAEKQDYLNEQCKGIDTVMLCKFIGEIANPISVLGVISNSDIKQMILTETVSSVTGTPSLEYRFNSSTSNFSGNSNSKNMGDSVTLVAMPNVPWLTSVLYYMGWKIEKFNTTQDFNPGWFSAPHQVAYPPRILQTAHILARKF